MPRPKNRPNGNPSDEAGGQTGEGANGETGGNPGGQTGEGASGEAGGNPENQANGNPEGETGGNPEDQANGNPEGETALAPVPEGPVYQALSATPEEMDHFITAIRTNLGGEKITDRDLDRITLPAGGSRQWEVPTIEGSEYTDTLEGIIIHQTLPRAYWKKDLDEGGGRTPPDCSSPDGERGFFSEEAFAEDEVRPSGDCFSCPFNEWNTASRGSGKACKEKRMLFLLRPGDMLPVVVQAPSTSIQPVRKHFLRLTNQNPPQIFYHGYTHLQLEKVEGDPFDYSRIVLRSGGAVPEAQRPQLEKYINALSPLLNVSVQQDE